MKTYIDYQTFCSFCLAMADKIGEWKPDALVAVARGGFSAAHIIAKHLNLRCGVYYPGDDHLFIPQSFNPVKRIVFIEDLIAEGRTLKLIEHTMNHQQYSNIEWKIAPFLIDDKWEDIIYKHKIITYGIKTPHWTVMPYEEFSMMNENDRSFFRDGK